MEERINQYIRGRRIIIDDINIRYSFNLYYNGRDYTLTFYFNDLNLKISYSMNEHIIMRLNQTLDFIFSNYIPEKINENINFKQYIRRLKLEKLKNRI